jgi:anti-anti-sigma factor
MTLQVQYEQKAADVFVVHLDGTLNSNTYPILETRLQAVLDHKPHILVLDMQQLSYLSSAGIRVILKTRDALKKNDGKIVFMHLQPQIRKVFDIINALPSMRVFASVKELDDYLDAMQKAVTDRKDSV